MSWLSGAFVKAILDWIFSKITAAFSAWKKDKANHEAQINQAAQDMQKAKEVTVETPEKEVDDAIDDALKHMEHTQIRYGLIIFGYVWMR